MAWRSLALLLLHMTLITRCQIKPSVSPLPPSSTIEQWWSRAGRAIGLTIQDCWSRARAAKPAGDAEPTNRTAAALSDCLQVRARSALRRLLRADVIPISDGVELVRYPRVSGADDAAADRPLPLPSPQTSPSASPVAVGWRSLVIDTVADLFETHAIRISMSDAKQPADKNEARRRRKNQMFPLMMFGLLGLGTILVPMGFQFLAVLGGKALLLAKMALILTSIQGLKKVAHSNINYGYDRKAEDLEHPYKTEEIYYNHYPDQLFEYKRYPRP